MSYQVLARKWRPGNFSELVGQEHVQRALVSALDNDRLHHAYLFTGTRGVGKTTIARIFAKSLNCEQGVGSSPCGVCRACEEIAAGRFIDLVEVDAASRTKVEDTRELLENVQYAPASGRYKVYLIDEVHMLSGHSFNALLKTLEEPPPHVKFLLATTDPQKLPVTVLSRCLQFNLKSLTLSQITGQLQHILEAEGIQAEPGAVRQLAIAASGSMRDGLSLLDQAIAYCNGELTEADVGSMLGTIDRAVIVRLVRALAAQDAPTLLAEVAAVDDFAPDYATLLADMLSLLQRIALAQVVPDAIDDELDNRDSVLELAQQLSPEDAQLFYQIGLIGRRDLPLTPDPRSGFEMVLLRMLAFRPARPESLDSGPVAAASVAKTAAAAKSGGSEAVAAAAAGAGGCEWSEIIARLPVKGMVREMALNCVFEGLEGDDVRLSIQPSHAHLHSGSRQRALESALSRHYGRTVQIRLAREPVLASETPAQRQSRELEERRQRAVATIQEDANIKALQDVFGATISEDSILPNE